MKVRLLGGCLGLLVLSAGGNAGTNCPQHFFQGVAPSYDPVSHTPTPLVERCHLGFALNYSPYFKTSIYAAEYLTPSRIDAARQLTREDSFRPDPELPSSPKLADYKGSGYHRGHLAPNGDMGDRETQSESFLLTNMIPQNPSNNQGIWSKIEGAVRDYVASNNRPVYVLTGPLYTSGEAWINQHVAIPNAVFKAVIDPGLKAGAVYISPNDESQTWTAISIAEFTRRYHWQLTPLSPNLAMMQLPEPKGLGTGAKYRKHVEKETSSAVGKLLRRLF